MHTVCPIHVFLLNISSQSYFRRNASGKREGRGLRNR